MKVLEYVGLDISRVRAQYRKVREAIERDDFRQAEVKKLAGASKRALYRAKLDDANRLLFTLLRCGDQRYALMLEVIEQHAYDKSRFLRGARIDDTKVAAVDAAAVGADGDAEPVRYIHPERREIHLLDKVISFDDAQHEVFGLPPPLIVVGSAGSGKTALTLEKLKGLEGEVLYVTRSAFLARNARDLYFHEGFDAGRQETSFLSYREFLESLRVPAGREVQWRDFSAWFSRQQQAFRGIDRHHAFEEIQGVLAAAAQGPLDRAAYLALGVRQSMFVDDRERLFDLFERYRAWLGEAGLYDASLIAHQWREHAGPRYDFVVIDEVQDLTNSQLALVLATLKKPGQFLLCGDSNQIVHPNFFSWSKVKSLFWQDEALAERQELRVLRANYRNGRETTRIANTLLRIKQLRFGSIDRESNFLVDPVGAEAGSVTLVADRDAGKKDLDQRTRQSTRVAVLVMRDEDKDEARQHFHTPLLFSVHEAKGLEYDSIVLYRFVSGHRLPFADITEGVDPAALEGEILDYRRARDKSDKSLEIQKFFVNALYVALTRAIRHVYLVESDLEHPLLQLLGLKTAEGAIQVEAAAASRDDWQKEARRLELQGKQEQAEAIRERILRQVPVPWPVFDEAWLRETLAKVFRQQAPGNKPKQQLLEYAACYDEPALADWLADAGFQQGKDFGHLRNTLGRKHTVTYYSPRFKDILQACDRYGVDHRTPMNQTPLMAAAAAGNIALVEALLERGANPDLADHLGRNALHWALLEAFRDPKYAAGPFAALYERLAPAAVDLKSDQRLVRIDAHLSEYLLVQTLWALFKSRFARIRGRGVFDTAIILEAWQFLPASVLRPERNRRQHLSGLLSRNEVDRDYAWNRRLFKRLGQGRYQFNPALEIRRLDSGSSGGGGGGASGSGGSGSGSGGSGSGNGGSEAWVPVFDALNLRLVAEAASPWRRDDIDQLLAAAGQAPLAAQIGGGREGREKRELEAQQAAWLKSRAAQDKAREEAAQRREVRKAALRAVKQVKLGSQTGNPQGNQQAAGQEARPGPDAGEAGGAATEASEAAESPATAIDRLLAGKRPPWGTPQARRYEIEKLRREIAERQQREAAARDRDGEGEA